MFAKLYKLLKSNTVRQSIITTASIFFSSGLGAVYYLILARAIGPHEYGLFSLGIAALSIAMSIADLGIGTGLVKFVGSHRENRQYFPFVKLALQIKIAMGILTTVIFGFGAAIIAKFVFHQPELTSLLRMVGIAVLFQLLFFLSSSIFQGLQKFTYWGGLQVGANLIRLLFLAPLIYFAKVSSFSAFFVFTASYFVGFIISLFWLDLGWLKSSVLPGIRKEFWDFNGWTAVFVILASVVARLDTLLSGRYLSLTEVGVYSLAVTMVSFLPQLASAVGAVTTAKFAGIKDRTHESEYLRKSLFFVTAISLGISVLMVPVAYIVVLITGKAYTQAILPFVILLLANIIFLSTNPIRDSILYFHSKPKFFVFLSIVQGIVVLISGLILIPKLGVVGAAITVGISQIVCAVLSTAYYLSLKE